jgi:hypothetical protein
VYLIGFSASHEMYAISHVSHPAWHLSSTAGIDFNMHGPGIDMRLRNMHPSGTNKHCFPAVHPPGWIRCYTVNSTDQIHGRWESQGVLRGHDGVPQAARPPNRLFAPLGAFSTLWENEVLRPKLATQPTCLFRFPRKHLEAQTNRPLFYQTTM